MLSNAKEIAEIVQRVSPSTLVSAFHENARFIFDASQVIMDAVCSVASEEIRMDEWGLDIVMTASQKGLSTPPGLSIVVASQKAISVG